MDSLCRRHDQILKAVTLCRERVAFTGSCKLPCLFGFVSFVWFRLSVPKCDHVTANHLVRVLITMAPTVSYVSLELRERIVVWWYELNMLIQEITQLSGHSKRTVN